MAYICYIYRFLNSNEYEYRYRGKYGCRGEKRAERRKPTPEQIRRQNQTNRENAMRRLMKANFVQGDLWVTLKYPAGSRPPLSVVEHDRRRFFGMVRREYKKRGYPFKYIYRVEVGEKGGIHFHMLANRIWDGGEPTDILLDRLWKKVLATSWVSRQGKDIRTDGMCDYTPAYEAGGFEGLAKYVTKQPEADSGEEYQLELFGPAEQKKLLAVNSSRNLVRPEPEKVVRQHWTVRRLIEHGPEPTPGYYIDQESVKSGVNAHTGMSYLKYTEIKLEEWRGYRNGG